jgi:hypothetical protein
MALTLIKEDGSGKTNSNSYADVSDSNSYHETRLHSDDWTNAGSEDQEAALVWATSLLDDLVDWNGRKWKEDQALDWPRSSVMTDEGYSVDVDEIPQAIVDATCELARTLLVEDTTRSPDTLGFSYIRAGEVAMNIDKRDRDSVYVITDLVKSMVAPFGTVRPRSTMTAKLIRT